MEDLSSDFFTDKFFIKARRRNKFRKRKCKKCRRYYLPDVRHRSDQKYCKHCGRLVKREQRKKANRKYWQSPKGKKKKRLQNQRYRKKAHWIKYILAYIKLHKKRIKEINRKSANRYYHRNRRKIIIRNIRLKKSKHKGVYH
jgi:hypothetical protein